MRRLLLASLFVLFISSLALSANSTPLVEGEECPPRVTIQQFDLKTRKTERLVDNVRQFDVSFDGEKILYQEGENWFINPADHPPQPGKGMLNTAAAIWRITSLIISIAR